MVFDEEYWRRWEEKMEKEKPKYKKLNQHVLERFPEMQESFDRRNFFDGIETGSTIIFDGLVSPFTYENLHDKRLVQRIFDFVEELLVKDEHEYAHCSIDVSFFENLVYTYDPRLFFEFVPEGTKSYELMIAHIKQKLGIVEKKEKTNEEKQAIMSYEELKKEIKKSLKK